MSASSTKLAVPSLLACMLAALIAFACAGQAHAASPLVSLASDGGAPTTQATPYDVFIADTRITSDNASDVLNDGGSVTYDPSTQTLTLNKAKITRAHVGKGLTQIIGSGILYGLPSGTFTINVKGSNKISTPTIAYAGESASYTYGISETENNRAKLKITGNGSLAIRAGGASLTSCGLYVRHAATVQGKVKLSSTGTAATRVSNGIAAVNASFTIKGSAQVTAKGETGAFYKAPKFSSYKPKVKAGYSAKKLKVNKKKPAKKTYTKYQYVKITRAASTSSKSTASSAKKPAKVKITKVDVLSGQFLVHWSPLSKNCSGYQMEVAESSKFPANATRKYALVTDEKYGGAYAWGLTSGTRYYVRVRAYHTVGAKKVWGAYSNVKSAVALGSALRVG